MVLHDLVRVLHRVRHLEVPLLLLHKPPFGRGHGRRRDELVLFNERKPPVSHIIKDKKHERKEEKGREEKTKEHKKRKRKEEKRRKEEKLDLFSDSRGDNCPVERKGLGGKGPGLSVVVVIQEL